MLFDFFAAAGAHTQKSDSAIVRSPRDLPGREPFNILALHRLTDLQAGRIQQSDGKCPAAVKVNLDPAGIIVPDFQICNGSGHFKTNGCRATVSKK
jgi:hypothetical protein